MYSHCTILYYCALKSVHKGIIVQYNFDFFFAINF